MNDHFNLSETTSAVGVSTGAPGGHGYQPAMLGQNHSSSPFGTS